MTWQSWVLGFVSSAFALALVPSLRARVVMPLSTTITTAGGLTLVAVCYATLHYGFYPVASTVWTAVGWWILTWIGVADGLRRRRPA